MQLNSTIPMYHLLCSLFKQGPAFSFYAKRTVSSSWLDEAWHYSRREWGCGQTHLVWRCQLTFLVWVIPSERVMPWNQPHSSHGLRHVNTYKYVYSSFTNLQLLIYNDRKVLIEVKNKQKLLFFVNTVWRRKSYLWNYNNKKHSGEFTCDVQGGLGPETS